MIQTRSLTTNGQDSEESQLERQQEMIEDKATERWKERAKKLGLIVNMGADKPQPGPKSGSTDGKIKATKKKGSEK